MTESSPLAQLVEALSFFCTCAHTSVVMCEGFAHEGNIPIDNDTAPHANEAPAFLARLVRLFSPEGPRTPEDLKQYKSMLAGESALTGNLEQCSGEIRRIAGQGVAQTLIAPPGFSGERWLVELLVTVDKVYRMLVGKERARYTLGIRASQLPKIRPLIVSLYESAQYLECQLAIAAASELEVKSQDKGQAKPVARARKPKGDPVKLSAWAIGRGGKVWFLFRRLRSVKEWAHNGNIDIPGGQVDKLAQLFAEKGGCVSKQEAISFFRQGQRKQRTPREAFDSYCKPNRRGLAKAIREGIERATDRPVDDNPIPWEGHSKAWRCVVQIGYAIPDDDGRLQFRTFDQLCEGDKADARVT